MSANSLSSSIAMFAAPVLSNSTVSTQKFGTISSLTKREKKEKKKRRNRTESKISLESESVCSKDTAYTGNSQWYTTPASDADSISLASFNSNTPMSPTFDLQDVSGRICSHCENYNNLRVLLADEKLKTGQVR